MPESSTQDSPSEEEITRFPLDWYQNFGLTAQSNAVRLARDKDGKLWGLVVTGFASNPASGTVRNYMPSAITDPTESATAGNSIVRCFGTPGASGVTDATVGLVVNCREMLYSTYNGTWYPKKGNYLNRTVSGAHVAQSVTLVPLNTSGLVNSLEIISECSAGTATLLVEVSVNLVNWVTADSIAAAATTIQTYLPTTAGGTTAVHPLSWPIIRITAGDAGVGNTTTLTIAMK